MAERSKLYNDSKGFYGIKLQGGREYNIEPRQFISLSEDDLDYVVAHNQNSFKEPHILRIEDAEVSEKLGVVVDEVNAFNVDTITAKLNQRPAALKKWLGEITSDFALDMIYDVAMQMDLANSKLKILKEKMPDRSFLDNDE